MERLGFHIPVHGNGYRLRRIAGRLFCLRFSFIGWDILSILTLGIGDLWRTPYQNAATAAFYRELVPLEKGEETEEMQETQTEEDVISEE